MTTRLLRGVGAALAGSGLLIGALSGCDDGQRVAPKPFPSASISPTPTPASPSSTPTPSASASSTPSTSPTTTPAPTTPAATTTSAALLGTTPPAWLGTRVLKKNKHGVIPPQQTPPELVRRDFTLPDTLPELPGSNFASKTVKPAPADVIARSTWSAACPVAAEDLGWIRLTFWGFDNQRHTGELLVAADETKNIVRAFHALWDIRFPIEQMHITTAAENKAKPTGDGNNTSAFNCRPVRGATSWSQHAYGLAVDVNPFQNPYVKGTGPATVVLPELARSYVNRTYPRPGMILPDSPAVRAFSQVGWKWGGYWKTLQDLQHFSLNDR